MKLRHLPRALAAALLLGAGLSACVTSPTTTSNLADANNPSPTAGSSSSQKANEMADKAMYKPIEYANAGIRGPALVIIPGEIKSNNATFTQKFGSNNIADYAELELSKANFGVLERSNLGPLLNEFQLAYNLGDPDSARKVLQKGKFKTTKWVVKFDILKAEQVASATESFDGRAAGQLLGTLMGGRGGAVTETVVGSVKTGEGTGVWIIGMRYKVMNANTTEQVATGYSELKMEVGAKTQSFMGVSSSAAGGLTLDGMVQRLVQTLVWEIDSKHKGPGEAAKAAPAPAAEPAKKPAAKAPAAKPAAKPAVKPAATGAAPATGTSAASAAKPAAAPAASTTTKPATTTATPTTAPSPAPKN